MKLFPQMEPDYLEYSFYSVFQLMYFRSHSIFQTYTDLSRNNELTTFGDEIRTAVSENFVSKDTPIDVRIIRNRFRTSLLKKLTSIEG